MLRVENLEVGFDLRTGFVKAVRGIDLSIPEGKTVALLGESGCGKSLTGMAILRILEEPGRISGGAIRFCHSDGSTEDLAALDEDSKQLMKLRGGEIALISQDARSALTPVYTIGEQIVEMILAHESTSKADAWNRAVSLLAEVGIPAPERRVREYPYQMSGGMCQRALIAMALSCGPRLLIADEPTTALDVTIQAQVLNLLRALQRDKRMSILIITHDMGVVAEMADEVHVMYLGKIVESGDSNTIFRNPQHPYTMGLFTSIPLPDSDPDAPLSHIRGVVPDISHTPEGCPFRGRCPLEMEQCTTMPPKFEMGDGHSVACWLSDPAHGGDS
ncbi:ABC transporter ATP-binding protein [bacterium]|nr:ABC transporter ATP-binding protein [bacterium]